MIRRLCYDIGIASVIVLALSTVAQPQDKATEQTIRSETTEVNTSSTVENKSERQKAIEEQIRSKIADVKASSTGPPQEEELEHIRGQIISLETSSHASAAVVKTADGKTVHLKLPDDVTIISLTKGSFTEVDFGAYVGAVAVQLDEYSPIIRDSAVWLHKGFELRIIDNELRGIALGERKWDLVPGSIMAHGWVDDMEIRVISIKWGPTDYDETDVEIPRGSPVHKMSLGDKGLIKKGAHVFAGGKKMPDSSCVAVFVLVGQDGIVPAL